MDLLTVSLNVSDEKLELKENETDHFASGVEVLDPSLTEKVRVSRLPEPSVLRTEVLRSNWSHAMKDNDKEGLINGNINVKKTGVGRAILQAHRIKKRIGRFL